MMTNRNIVLEGNNGIRSGRRRRDITELSSSTAGGKCETCAVPQSTTNVRKNECVLFITLIVFTNNLCKYN